MFERHLGVSHPNFRRRSNLIDFLEQVFLTMLNLRKEILALKKNVFKSFG